MTELSPELRELAQACGVAVDYWDWRGRHVPVGAGTVVPVLAALGVDAGTPAAAAAALADRERDRWARMLPPCLVTREGHTPAFPVHVRHGDPVQVWVELEDGGRRDDVRQLENWEPPREVDGRLVGEASFAVPAGLPLGYHTLRARSGDAEAAAALVVTPAWLGLPERLGDRRAWGLATQLYSVRSRRSWGVGDLADLAELAGWAAPAGRRLRPGQPAARGRADGADGALAVPADQPPLRQPALPAGRAAWPSTPTCRRPTGPRSRRCAPTVQERAAATDTIDRDASWAAKRAALRLVHAVPRTTERDAAYAAYQRARGAGADRLRHLVRAGRGARRRLAGVAGRSCATPAPPPSPPSGPTHQDAVDFHRWLQWLTDEQLGRAGPRRARAWPSG